MEETEIKHDSGKGRRGRKHHGSKKKGGKFKKQQSTGNEFFKGVGFYVGREGPEL
jgi:hypothetical protein